MEFSFIHIPTYIYIYIYVRSQLEFIILCLEWGRGIACRILIKHGCGFEKPSRPWNNHSKNNCLSDDVVPLRSKVLH